MRSLSCFSEPHEPVYETTLFAVGAVVLFIMALWPSAGRMTKALPRSSRSLTG